MSRGGFRGGRGGGRGGGPRGGPEIPMGDLNYGDIQATVQKEGRALFPEYSLPYLKAPTDAERRICLRMRDLRRAMRSSPYRLVEKTKSDHSDLKAYTDKYKAENQLTTTSLDPQALGLDKAFFPEQIWSAYFDPKKKVKVKKLKKEKKSLDDDKDDDDEADSEASNDGSERSNAEEEPDYDEEEDPDDDYGNQYFDNGEGDDFGDEGGGDDEGTY